MTTPRYLALVGTGEERRRCAALTRQLRTDDDLALLLEAPYLEVWSNSGRVPFDRGDGALIGEIFDRYGDGRSAALTQHEWDQIVASNGQEAIDRYWGNYILFLAHDDGLRIVRAPFGDVGCYHARTGAIVVIASDLNVLRLALDAPPGIDREMVIRHIGYPEWRGDRTCLAGIDELRGGNALDIAAATTSLQTLWLPWSFAARERRIDDREGCANRIHDIVRRCIRQRLDRRTRVVLLLSGGLDSSVTAASLAHAEIDFSCLNLTGEDATSDERNYAADIARHVGKALANARFDPERVDPRVSGAAHMPYPVHRCFTQAQDAIAEEYARSIGADAIVDGGGGDNVFFAMRTLAILADCLIEGGLDHRFFEVCSALANATQTARWKLAGLSCARAWLRSPAPRQAPYDKFLSASARAVLERAERHAWFEPPDDCLPGRASHIALLVPAQNLAEAINAQAPFPAISPLIAQPVVETCLRVPSWFWLEHGRDRAATRHAFAQDLPRRTIDRQSKGSPAGFVAGIYERNRAAIRDMLLGGRLQELNLIDERRLTRYLDMPGPVTDHRFVRVMELVDVEAWLRSQPCQG